MTTPIAPVVPSRLPTERRVRGRREARGQRPLPVAVLAGRPTPAVLYRVAAVDRCGRVAERSVIRALGWAPGLSLDIVESGGTLVVRADFIQDWLGMLIEHDVRERSELVTTLAAFLQHNHDYPSTASRLGIHRSTARYRIHRIAQLTQLDIYDLETAQNLRAAIRAFAKFSGTP
jgi:PucR-like helix-turn-helix protein